MRVAAVTTARNECDIIESFVRHNAAFFDCLYIQDHRSTDNTPDILHNLEDEGLPLVLSREDHGIFYQSSLMTQLIKRAFDDYPWDFIFPLDSDEFLRIPDRAALEAVLAELDGASVGLSNVIHYIPTENDDLNELDVLRRIVHVAKTIPDISSKIGKVILPGAVIKQPGFLLNEGHHGASIDGKAVPNRRLDALSLAHFPIRSINQFTLRSILCHLSWSSRSDYNPAWGLQSKFVKQLKIKPTISTADLTEAALMYVDIYLQTRNVQHQKVLVREPVTPTYDQLRFTTLTDMTLLPPLLDMMDVLLGELRATRIASAVHAGSDAEATETEYAVGNWTTARAIMNRSSLTQHRFQSFWYGEPLSPYELFCLKSFIDWGHAVDLYTYDVNLVVPAGVRVCDAAELISQHEVFVYQAEGFGKGSPSAFSNVFRYKLLVEKGGWWIDTDIVCLTERIPVVHQFFARQDADFINGAIMYFEPQDPIMVQCLDQAMKLGRSVKWGDTGPRLLTRVLEERGCLDQAAPASVCYPIHHSQAVDVLRPSRTANLAPQIEPSLFLHVWHSMLVHLGVQKTFRPPKGSLLRKWTDKHPVDGWIGEYDERTLEHGLNLKAELNASAKEKNLLKAERNASAKEKTRLKAELNASLKNRAQLQAALERKVQENEAILTSTSWRLTAPLRAGGRRLLALRFFGQRR